MEVESRETYADMYGGISLRIESAFFQFNIFLRCCSICLSENSCERTLAEQIISQWRDGRLAEFR